jgi:hypothetical protein
MSSVRTAELIHHAVKQIVGDIRGCFQLHLTDAAGGKVIASFWLRVDPPKMIGWVPSRLSSARAGVSDGCLDHVPAMRVAACCASSVVRFYMCCACAGLSRRRALRRDWCGYC